MMCISLFQESESNFQQHSDCLGLYSQVKVSSEKRVMTLLNLF